MENEESTTQTVESVPAETGSQAAEPVSQETAQTQETVQPQGREAAQPTSSNREARPSNFWAGRQIKSLQQEIAELKNMISQNRNQSAPPVAPAKTKFDHTKFWTAPDEVLGEVLSDREKELMQRFEKELFEKKLPEFLNTNEQRRSQERNEQEALEMLFPKSSPEAAESLEARVASNPELADKIVGLMQSTGLDVLSRTHPKEAVRLTMKLLEEKPAPNPTVLKKSLMGGTARGNPSGGNQRSRSEKDVLSELKKMNDQLESNSTLRQDPEFKKRRGMVMQELERLTQEVTG